MNSEWVAHVSSKASATWLAGDNPLHQAPFIRAAESWPSLFADQPVWLSTLARYR